MSNQYFHNPADLLSGYASRSASFENPAGAPSAGGTAAGGRKGAPFRVIQPGERVVLADLSGPGTITHFWATLNPTDFSPSAEFLRSQLLEIFYDGLAEPSVSVPALDFFGAVHGLLGSYGSALTTINEGRGLASRIPLPFHESARVEWVNASDKPAILYYQIDFLLGSVADGSGILHAAFRRENPTTLLQDFVVTDGWQGPGRFLGWTGGVRVLDPTYWWGEGEVKVYFDGEALPTICGTGTEDYLDSAWGLGAFSAPETGVPLLLRKKNSEAENPGSWVSFYRWHLSDPIVFARSLKVTIQQIGVASFDPGEEEQWTQFKAGHTAAGQGWVEGWIDPDLPGAPIGIGLFERSDDWCATAFVYCSEPQAVPRPQKSILTGDLIDDPGKYEPLIRPD